MRAHSNIVQLTLNESVIDIALQSMINLPNRLLYRIVLLLEVLSLKIIQNRGIAMLVQIVITLREQPLTLPQPPLQRATLPAITLTPPPLLTRTRRLIAPTPAPAFPLGALFGVHDALALAVAVVLGLLGGDAVAHDHSEAARQSDLFLAAVKVLELVFEEGWVVRVVVDFVLVVVVKMGASLCGVVLDIVGTVALADLLLRCCELADFVVYLEASHVAWFMILTLIHDHGGACAHFRELLDKFSCEIHVVFIVVVAHSAPLVQFEVLWEQGLVLLILLRNLVG